MSDQVWTVAVTPAQRLILLNLSHDKGQALKGQRGRVFRRFMRAFGINAISIAAGQHPKGEVNGKLATSSTPALHTLTIENVDYALALEDVEHHPMIETVIGPLFDVLEDLKAGREYTPLAGTPDYDPAAEDWVQPLALPPPEAHIPERIAAYLRAQGEAHAAELVDRGGWDRPAFPPPPNVKTEPAANGETHPAS